MPAEAVRIVTCYRRGDPSPLPLNTRLATYLLPANAAACSPAYAPASFREKARTSVPNRRRRARPREGRAPDRAGRRERRERERGAPVPRRTGTDLSGLAEEINSGSRLDQLLGGLVPLGVVLPRTAHRRADRQMGHAKGRAILWQAPASVRLTGRNTPAPPHAIRPLAACPFHHQSVRGSRMMGGRRGSRRSLRWWHLLLLLHAGMSEARTALKDNKRKRQTDWPAVRMRITREHRPRLSLMRRSAIGMRLPYIPSGNLTPIAGDMRPVPSSRTTRNPRWFKSSVNPAGQWTLTWAPPRTDPPRHLRSR
jgi:hypothetical protein